MRIGLLLIIFHLSSHSFAQVALIRGPYLQAGTSSEITLRWRTSVPTSSQVNIGLKVGTYFKTAKDENLKTEHEVVIDQLQPDTKYYYAIISGDILLQGDESNNFTTYPAAGNERKLRFWVTGDCGNNSDNQRSVRDQYLQYAINQRTDGWLLLGDNAYDQGKDQEYQTGFFDQYQTNIMKSTVLWPATGNHDYANDPALQNSKAIPYYDIFTLPTEGQAGGVASNTESYYSYTIGNVHFIALDSYGKEEMGYRMYDTLSPQIEWLKKDLEASKQTWNIAYWHHPPYTKGSHDSDAEDELILIRKNLVRVLERFNVDLVLCGHSHSYERTKLMKGHYDQSVTFDPTKYFTDISSGRYDGTPNSCPFKKHTDRNSEGIVYVVTGSAGKVGGSTAGFPHRAMVHSDRTIGGSVIIEIEKNRLDLKWLTTDGIIADQFTMMKDVNLTTTQAIMQGTAVKLSASWVGEYLWSEQTKTSRSVDVNPYSDNLYIVTDGINCLTDSIKIVVIPVTNLDEDANQNDFRVYPNPAADVIFADVFDVRGSVTIHDALGNVIASQDYDQTRDNCTISFDRQQLRLGSGIYYMSVWTSKTRRTVKLLLK